MNTKEYVKLKTDTSFIPVKYAVLEVYGAGLLWLKAVSYGFDTEANFKDYEEKYKNSKLTGLAKPVGMIPATLGVYTTSAISDVSEWNGKSDHGGPYEIG